MFEINIIWVLLVVIAVVWIGLDFIQYMSKGINQEKGEESLLLNLTGGFSDRNNKK
ncbi:MAG: hypothetical protein Ct9H300mP20_20970 [Gammaproteobacteria bacterium]|nr:MAG: hypothetical protein Ct9H300mP20_20970 [Gammaproteobacteria bacterium]